MTTRTFTVRVSDSAGNETVGTKTFQVGTGETILTGDIDAIVPAGTTARLRGSCRLLNNLHVRGTLTADPTGVDLDGQGLWDIHTHDGGVLNLVGVERTAWCRWGDTPVGWQVGDSVLVAPTVAGVFAVTATIWQGSWAATVRPANSPDVLLPDGNVARPEVMNRSQSLTIRNVTRIMLHESEGQPNVHTLKWLRVLDSGKSGQLTFYPIHFHHLGDTCRGSLVEGVVVHGGKNHAFVVHGSHGVTLRGCAAYNTTDDAYWWDPPVGIPPALQRDHTANNSNDTSYDRCLVMHVVPKSGDAGGRLSAFHLGAGSGNRCIDSAATCVQGGSEAAGFHWPESANQNAGGNEWVFQRNVAHNNKSTGIFVWQNDSRSHEIEDFIGYRSGLSQIDHGAYNNRYHYLRCVLMGGSEAAFKLHAVNDASGFLLLEDIVSDRSLRLTKHNLGAITFAVVRRCTWQIVYYSELGDSGTKLSKVRYEDCVKPNDPSDFDLSGIIPQSIIEIYAAGVLTHRWAGGSWQP